MHRLKPRAGQASIALSHTAFAVVVLAAVGFGALAATLLARPQLGDACRPTVVGGPFAGGSPLYRPEALVAAELVVENPWVRIESHTVRMKDARKPGGFKEVSGWWWLQVADHINVLPQISVATARDIVARAKKTLPASLQRLHPSPAAQALLKASDGAAGAGASKNEEDEPLFLLYRQSKYGITGTDSKETIAVVGGLKNDTLDARRGLRDTAERELSEELGMVSTSFVQFGTHRVDGNRGCGTIGTFLAKDASIDPDFKPPADGDNGDLEPQIALLVTLDDLHGALTRGEIEELKWSHTIAMALLHFRAELFRGGANPAAPRGAALMSL